MMKLSLMKKVSDTVNTAWRSPLADHILERWGYDIGTVFYWRASANFVFLFKRDGKNYYLRFNASPERKKETIEAEIELLLYLDKHSITTAQPVVSKSGQYVETIQTADDLYYAVVFEALPGDHPEIEELTLAQFQLWGRELGRLHAIMKNAPIEVRSNRPSWLEQLNNVREQLPEEEVHAIAELERCIERGLRLQVDEDRYGLIHYDCELDNHRWSEGEIGILDFDDCCMHWYIADIAYSLRGLSEWEVDLEDPRVQSFIQGYEKEKKVDKAMLSQLQLFMRMHHLVLFGKLLRSVDILPAADDPDWLKGLRDKLLLIMDKYRMRFEQQPFIWEVEAKEEDVAY